MNPFADRHRRDEPDVVARLTALRDGDVGTAARALLALVPDFACEAAAVAQALDVEAGAVREALAGADDVVALPDARTAEAWATRAKWDRLVATVLALVADAHRERPTEPGVEMEHLRSQSAADVTAKTFRWCIDRLVADRRLVRAESLVRLPGHAVVLGAGDRALGERVEGILAAAGFTPPDLRGLEERCRIGRKDLTRCSPFSGATAEPCASPPIMIRPGAVGASTRLLAEHCRTHGEISAAVFRDLIGASRKFAIALLDWCDRTGVTTRVGDMRRLRR